MASIDLDDVQGLVFRGYRKLRGASYHLLQFRDIDAVRLWIGRLAARVTPGGPASRDGAVHIAFTPPGLQKLGLPPDALSGFSDEFTQGITHPNRTRRLGDTDASAPERWAWGGPTCESIDAVLLLYSIDDATLRHSQDDMRKEWAEGGVVEIKTLETTDTGNKEHFGFADGISQPSIEGYHRTTSTLHTIKAGEFLLGYLNEYGLYTDRPILDGRLDPEGVLAPALGAPAKRDFGRNGTYLVFRQLRQDVPGFRATLDSLTRDAGGKPNDAERVRLASRMVGRWPGGASLVDAPLTEPTKPSSSNEFLYHPTDQDGRKCPIGSHVRRANPRDSLDPDPGSAGSIALGKRHRIIRRGREYGPMLPEGAVDDHDRGIMFISLNAGIARQFEFIQQTWINSPHFDGLYHDADPIVGPLADRHFTAPADPVRERYRGLPRFVNVVGGAYFFLPGIRALKYLAQPRRESP